MKIWSHSWRDRLLPALSITSLVMLLRFAGFLQFLEWRTFDLALRQRPAEPPDTRVTIVAITENDIQSGLGHPISDADLADLIQTLNTYNPRVIGVDIIRDIPLRQGKQALFDVFKTSPNVIGINSIMGSTDVKAHPALPETQVGFVDVTIDGDGSLRRSPLGEFDRQNRYQYSFSIRLAEQYLAAEGLTLSNGIKDPEAMRFGKLEIPRFRPNTGGYIREIADGPQTLINFRAGSQPFQKLSYSQIVSGQADPSLVEDKAVIIGYIAESIPDFINSAAIVSENPSLIPGAEIQAHATSQILSAFYDNRPFIKALPEPLDYLVILSGGLLGMTLALWQRGPTLHWLLTINISVALLILYYALIVVSWWLPIIPALIAFSLNAIGLYPLYQTKAQLQAQIAERKALINWTYNTIHNGPLQLLAGILSDWPASLPSSNNTKVKLEELNRELRNIYEAMYQEMLMTDSTLVMAGQRTIDLKVPLDAVLYETYQSTLERQSDFFKKVIQITNFEPIPDKKLTSETKRELARFLEEALINVYKYAKSATRLSIDCRQEGKFNVIRITDNGKERPISEYKSKPLSIGSQLQKLARSPSGQRAYGTQQASRLARQLNGQFSRTNIKPHGVCCELRWPKRA